MASEDQKQAVLQAIRNKIEIAERSGLVATARSWRELHVNTESQSATEIIMAINAAETSDF